MSIFRPLALFLAIMLVVTIGLHLVIPHDHPGESHHEGMFVPLAHMEEKWMMFLVALATVIGYESVSRARDATMRQYALVMQRRFINRKTIPSILVLLELHLFMRGILNSKRFR